MPNTRKKQAARRYTEKEVVDFLNYVFHLWCDDDGRATPSHSQSRIGRALTRMSDELHGREAVAGEPVKQVFTFYAPRRGSDCFWNEVPPITSQGTIHTWVYVVYAHSLGEAHELARREIFATYMSVGVRWLERWAYQNERHTVSERIVAPYLTGGRRSGRTSREAP